MKVPKFCVIVSGWELTSRYREIRQRAAKNLNRRRAKKVTKTLNTTFERQRPEEDLCSFRAHPEPQR